MLRLQRKQMLCSLTDNGSNLIGVCGQRFQRPKYQMPDSIKQNCEAGRNQKNYPKRQKVYNQWIGVKAPIEYGSLLAKLQID